MAQTFIPVGPKKEVLVRHYGGEANPAPNNYRVELVIGGHSFVYDPRQLLHNGCTTREEAVNIARNIGQAIGVELILCDD